MSSANAHPVQLKARAIDALMAGESVAVVSATFGVPLSTVKNWRADARRVQSVGPEKRAELGELVACYLQEVLETLSAQTRFARDETWLRSQNAHDLAILHGVLVDKAVRILAALEPDGES